jgi:DNA (cytosine-5)-methyltransferase 1
MKSVGLYAGVGGLELGLHRAGHEVLELCECDNAAKTVLRSRFKDVPIEADVRKLRRLPRSTEIVTAGFPCQDLSQAGRTRGILGSNSGLVMELFRLLERTECPWVVLENVPFMMKLAGGRGLALVLARLERLGYRWAYRVIDSRAFGLPQRRRRVYIVASMEMDPRRVLFADDVLVPDEPSYKPGHAHGFYWTEGNRGLGWAFDAVPALKGGSGLGIPSPPAIWLPDGQIITPSITDAERLQGFPRHWTEAAESRFGARSRWKLVGNAVSVPVAAWLGQRLRRKQTAIVRREWELGACEPWPGAAFNIGEGRVGVEIGEWPVATRRVSLHRFLRDPGAPLSHRAASGFLTRLLRSTLATPRPFRTALRAHIRRMR